MNSFALGMFEILGIYVGFITVMVAIVLVGDKRRGKDKKGGDNE